MNEMLNQKLEAAFKKEIDGNYITARIDPFELENLLGAMLQREDKLLRRIQALESQNITIGPIK